MTLIRDALDILATAAGAAADKLAADPVIIDVSQRLGLCDAFLITSAPTDRQVRAIAEEIMDRLREERDLDPLRIEGRMDAHWVLLDYGTCLVHVMTDADRQYYALEKLWGDCPQWSAQELVGEQGTAAR